MAAGAITVPVTSAAAEGDYKIAMLLDSSISDGGWGASCYHAMEDAAKEMGWETAYTDNVQTSRICNSYDGLCRFGVRSDFCTGK